MQANSYSHVYKLKAYGTFMYLTQQAHGYLLRCHAKLKMISQDTISYCKTQGQGKNTFMQGMLKKERNGI